MYRELHRHNNIIHDLASVTEFITPPSKNKKNENENSLSGCRGQVAATEALGKVKKQLKAVLGIASAGRYDLFSLYTF